MCNVMCKVNLPYRCTRAFLVCEQILAMITSSELASSSATYATDFIHFISLCMIDLKLQELYLASVLSWPFDTTVHASIVCLSSATPYGCVVFEPIIVCMGHATLTRLTFAWVLKVCTAHYKQYQCFCNCCHQPLASAHSASVH